MSPKSKSFLRLQARPSIVCNDATERVNKIEVSVLVNLKLANKWGKRQLEKMLVTFRTFKLYLYFSVKALIERKPLLPFSIENLPSVDDDKTSLTGKAM